MWKCNLKFVHKHGVFDLLFLHNFETRSTKLSLLSVMTPNNYLDVLLFYDTVFNFYRSLFFECKQNMWFFRICLKVVFQKPIKNVRCFIFYIVSTLRENCEYISSVGEKSDVSSMASHSFFLCEVEWVAKIDIK